MVEVGLVWKPHQSVKAELDQSVEDPNLRDFGTAIDLGALAC